MDIFSNLINSFKSFIKFLLGHFYEIVSDLLRSADNIPLNHLMKDTLSTLLSAGMILVFSLLAIVVFIFLPQGQDVLLIISEDISEGHVGSFFWLLLGTIIWSLFSEFGVRYAIYVTDNSGSSLSDARVQWRRKLQKVISDFFLLFPYIIVMLGMIFNRPINDVLNTASRKNIGFWVPIVVLYLVMSVVAHIYYHEVRKKEVAPTAGKTPNRKFPTFERLHKWLALTGKEKEWCEKLTGIYNPHVFAVPKSVSFQNKARTDMEEFERNFLVVGAGDTLASFEANRNNFPKNSALVADCFTVPAEFQLIKFTEDYKLARDAGQEHTYKIEETYRNGRYRWIYHIPNSFYKKLHKQLYIVVSLSIAFLLLMLLLSISYYSDVGAPGLLVLAFACWTGIYLGFLHVDYALFRRGAPLTIGKPVIDTLPAVGKPAVVTTYREPAYKSGSYFLGGLSLRFVMLLMLIISSVVNDDHPVRYNHYGALDTRPDLRTHFRSWFAQYKKDSVENQFYCRTDTARIYPIVFVCAEGGALRTGAYTSMMLGVIQDSLMKSGINFKQAVYAYSGVSGGSLGISFFNTLAYLDHSDNSAPFSYRERGRKFFETDYLSAVIARTCYSEIVQLVLPFHIDKLDRAIALEENWEIGYKDLGDQNYFGKDYLGIWNNAKNDHGMASYPAMFINTTEVESGLQCWLSNVKPDPDMYYSADRDLLHSKISGGINYSTMINFSTRFPLLSPAGCLKQSAGGKFHYIDGGYVENTGSATATEIINALAPEFEALRQNGDIVRPFVITLRFGEPPQRSADISAGNELSEILFGIYNVRGGRVKMAEKELETALKPWKGKVIPLKLGQNGKQVPMNWVLSKRSIDNLDTFIIHTWQNRTTNELKDLYCIDTSGYCRENCR